ncbi:membrane protein insertase YidC [Lactobacillus terrae]|uniref:membrane protein insertase YidC n=1 Tax=Lactobacillus terrae TaxID=2269374 RepID=UPI0015D0991D|nr:membrane protein insertase YidC [Lactobacillus terrae]
MKNKYIKYLSVFAIIAMFSLVATGCVQTGSNLHAPTSGPYGFIFTWIGSPFQKLITWTANTIGGSNGYAWGIVIISFVVRLVLLPLSLNQQSKSTIQQEKMRAIQPQLKLLQEKQKEVKDPAIQQRLSTMMMDIYKQNNISLTGGIGCLPLLIQMPVLIGIYQAVQYSPEIGKATFLSIPLGKPSIVIAIIATIFYIIQSWLSLRVVPEEQKGQMQAVMFMNPLITFFISMVSSAALALYFLVGGIVILIQQVITNYVIVPRIRKNEDDRLKDNPVKVVVSEEILNDIISGNNTTTDSEDNSEESSTPKDEDDLHLELRKRNENKQQNRDK